MGEKKMPDQLINLKIPSDKVSIALEGFLKIYPNIEMTEVDPSVKVNTNKQWVTEKIKRNTVRDIHRGLQIKANEDAKVVSDNNIVETI